MKVTQGRRSGRVKYCRDEDKTRILVSFASKGIEIFGGISRLWMARRKMLPQESWNVNRHGSRIGTGLMTLTGDWGSLICKRTVGYREGETQASGVADTADETEARSKRFILSICRPQMHAFRRSIRLRWSHKSTRFRARLALSPGASHKNTNKLTKNINKSLQKQIQSSFSDAPICAGAVNPKDKQFPHHKGSSLPGPSPPDLHSNLPAKCWGARGEQK